MQRNESGKNCILILGAAGFIGTNLTLRLLKEGKKLVLFDRPGASWAEAVQEAAKAGQARIVSGSFAAPGSGGRASAAQEGAEAVPGSGGASAAQESAETASGAAACSVGRGSGGEARSGWREALPMLDSVDTVYHLISTTCPTNSNRDVAGEMEENLISTIRFLDACVEAGVKKVVFLSSGGTVYGKQHTGICREEEEAFPITSYGVQKLAIEKMLYLYWEMHGLDYRIVRLSNPYGPYQRPNGVQGVVSTFTYRALAGQSIEVFGDGSVVRDYIYIEDAVEGILKIAEQPGRYRLYNLGCGQGHTVMDVIGAIEKVLGRKPEVIFRPGRPVDVPVNVLDVSRYEEDFGKPSTAGLEEGIRRLARFYQNSDILKK